MYQKRLANTGVKPKQMEKRKIIADSFFKNIGDKLKTMISDDIGDDTSYQ
jgi:cell division protein FtsA